MTFKEKLQQEHPYRFNKNGEPNCCPEDYGYRNPDHDCDYSCAECWNREMPEAKPTVKAEPEVDMASHPSHHADSCSIECIDVMEMVFGKDTVCLYAVINAFKCVWECRHKNGLEDLKKARKYLHYANNGLDHSYDDIYMKLKDLVEKLGTELDADQSKA